MILPNDEAALLRFARDLIDECMHSRERRRSISAMYRQLYYTGAVNGSVSKYNRCFSHVDKLSSFIFSPADLRYTVEFDGDSLDAWQDRCEATTNFLNRKFRSSNCGRALSAGNAISLVEGAAIAKLTWGAGGKIIGWPIRPSFFGVLREDITDLSLQEAFVHSYYVTESGFRRMVQGNRDAKELVSKVTTISAPVNSNDLTGDSYFHEIITQGMGPISFTPGSSNRTGYGTVALSAPMAPYLSPEVVGKLIKVDDLWVWNDEVEDDLGRTGDWTTLRYVDPGILVEGKYRKRNLSDIPGEHPFVKLCSNEVEGSFWGMSEMAVLAPAQDQLTRRTNDIDSLWNLRAKPPRSFTGFNSVTEERARALLSPGGQITEQAIGAKVDNLAPEMPPEALDYLAKLEEIFDDVGGFTNILSGQGEPGVRAGVHAGTLLRTSTPRLRDRALLLENQAGEFGTKALKMFQAKEAKVQVPDGDATKSFLLAQLPGDAMATVDSHTSSPAFVEDERQMAFSLLKAGAIDGRTLLEMVHPPREDLLKERLKQSQEAQAKWAAEHPVQAAEQAKKK